MAIDYYTTLGINRNASEADLQKAYRDLARKYHPDLNPDDKQAKEKFQQVQEAFDVLNDPKKREMYDRYGSSFEHAGAGFGGDEESLHSGGFEDIDLSQIFGQRGEGGSPLGGFAEMFQNLGGARGREARAVKQRGADIETELEIPFASAVTGGEAQISLRRRSGKVETLTVKVPVGIESGKKLRLRGQGEQGMGDGPPGDVIITVRVAAHPCFWRRGKNLYVKTPITLGEAINGAKVDVPTPRGVVSFHVPPGCSSGAKLRARGQGITPPSEPPGDLIAEIEIVLPSALDERSKKFFQDFDDRHPLDPRSELLW